MRNAMPKSETVRGAMTLLSRILEVLGSNLSRDMTYLD
jgi:hypothetical protein